MEALNGLGLWSNMNPFAIGALIAWSIAWKGFGLWRAAGLRQKYWFVAMLIVNTLGILEIIYLFYVSRGYEVEVIEEK